MTSSQYCQDLVLTRDVTMPHVTKKIFQCLDKQSLLNFRQVSLAWKNYVDNPTFWFKKLADDKTTLLFSNDKARGQEWKDCENEWKDLAKAAEKIEGMNQYFVLPLMKFFQGGPLKEKFTFKALGVVYDMSLSTHDNDDDVSEIDLESILVDFLLENVKPTKSIHTEYEEYGAIGAIHMASLIGRVEVVKKLVQKLRDPNFPNSNGWTPMHVAALNGELEIVKILSANTDHPNSKYRDVFTSIDLAAYGGYLEIVKFLVNLDDSTQDYDRAIRCAKRKIKQEVVEFLKTYTTKK